MNGGVKTLDKKIKSDIMENYDNENIAIPNKKNPINKVEGENLPSGGVFVVNPSAPLLGFKMYQGYIKLWRKIFETSFYQDSYALHLAINCILRANHKSSKLIQNNKEIILNRGQFKTGRLQLAQETGIKPSTIRNKLELLKSIGFLDIKSNNKYSIITICNYDIYQELNDELDNKKDNQRTTRGQPEDTDNNDKNDKNEKKKANIYLSDEDFIKTLKSNPAYKHINIDDELAKMDSWLLVRKGRQKTRRFIVSWFNRIDRPMGVQEKPKSKKTEVTPAPLPKFDPEQHKKVSELIHQTAQKLKVDKI